MIDVIFTDTHFGWKNNSMTWLNSQMRFIYSQFIPEIERLRREDSVRVIHCGDVFDSRSTISTYVASKVVQAFKDIREVCDEFVIVCGNHDFYSPNTDIVNTVDLFMGHLDITIVNQNMYESGDHAFIPWYVWERGDFKTSAKYIFTHADLLYDAIPKGCGDKTIFAGHIHTPRNKNGLYNLGSCYSLNFADSNAKRGFYVLRDGQIQFVENEVSINFHRLYNEEILNQDIEEFRVMDYVELYVSQENMSRESYVNAIKRFTEYFTHLWIIPQTTQMTGGLNEEFKGYDIASIMEASIPEDLTDFFTKVKNRVNLTENL
jgi:DNA repair exonuclease SbcCD nuclease subunit